MIRMEIALLLVLGFVANIYFSAGRRYSKLHRTFAIVLILAMIHLVFDGATLYTVNHLETVPKVVNEVLHRGFILTMQMVAYLFYKYIAIMVGEESGVPRRRNIASKAYLVIFQIGALVFPLEYAETPLGNYATGLGAKACYLSITFYLLLCIDLLYENRKVLPTKTRKAISAVLTIQCVTGVMQFFNPTWLISGIGITLMTLTYYLTLENPDIIRAELIEQKMSMLYLKSQVNPHFLYNTLDTIRIQAHLNQDKQVADMLMELVDFFRLSVKVDQQMVTVDDELELLEAYMDLMCYRYPKIQCEYQIDPDLGGALVPNFILQPLVENSMLHGLKNKGYQGNVTISIQKLAQKSKYMKIEIQDTGTGFEEGKEAIDRMLKYYDRQAPRLEGNSIGILNVQKRIKLLCGRKCGLWYTENSTGGVTAHLLLPIIEEETAWKN